MKRCPFRRCSIAAKRHAQQSPRSTRTPGGVARKTTATLDCCRLCQDMLVRQLLAVVTHAVCSRSCPEDTFTTESLAAVLRPTANAHLNKWCGHWLRRYRLPVSLSSLNSARRLCHLQVRARGHISPFHIMSTMLKPDEEGLAEAGRRLRAGNLVAFPTGVCFAPRVKTRVSHASNV